MSDELITARDILNEMRADIKVLVAGYNKFEERLQGGAKHFAELDADIRVIQARKCPRFPRPSIVYPLIVVGFTLLGFLVSIKG